jgi:transcriptional antiterminator
MKCSACEIKDETISDLRFLVALHDRRLGLNRLERAMLYDFMQFSFVKRADFAKRNSVTPQATDNTLKSLRKKLSENGVSVSVEVRRGHYLDEKNKARVRLLAQSPSQLQAPFQEGEHAQRFD